MTPQDRAEELVRRWESVDPFARHLPEHARLGLEREIAAALEEATHHHVLPGEYLDAKREREEALLEVDRLSQINQTLLKEKEGVDKELFGTVCLERDEALSREASLADLLNSWARESGVEQGQKQEDSKSVADRLWAHWSGKYHEALAQVAVLLRAIETSPLDSSDVQKMIAVGKLSKSVVTKARALLDRLQRAEAALTAFLGVVYQIRSYDEGHKATFQTEPEEWEQVRHLARIALAAWEEGKA